MMVIPESVKLIFQKYRYFFIVILIGLLFLIVPTSDGENTKESDRTELEFSVESLQNKIEKMLAKSEGVGRVELLLTLKSGVEQIYAEDARVTRDRQESEEQFDYHEDSDKKPSIISGDTGAETPVLVKQIYPEFLGATVVCDGAENATVRRLITDAIGALTGITADKIAILKMKQ
ncbi:MAG: hypothetical protein E7471_00180 [Ruminococcaceae bacterium]|nr:hypothetical protein [Oscillospiraceae bacterium]